MRVEGGMVDQEWCHDEWTDLKGGAALPSGECIRQRFSDHPGTQLDKPLSRRTGEYRPARRRLVQQPVVVHMRMRDQNPIDWSRNVQRFRQKLASVFRRIERTPHVQNDPVSIGCANFDAVATNLVGGPMNREENSRRVRYPIHQSGYSPRGNTLTRLPNRARNSFSCSGQDAVRFPSRSSKMARRGSRQTSSSLSLACAASTIKEFRGSISEWISFARS